MGDGMTLSIQDTLRLIHKMIEEGHYEQAIHLCKRYIPEAINHIETLERIKEHS